MTFKEWTTECDSCGNKSKLMCWDYELVNTKCGTCLQGFLYPVSSRPDSTLMIATDDIPGGLEIKHGLCNPDGSPRKYYSKTEIKQEANRRSYTIGGDTPKPYKVQWEGKRDAEA